MVNSLSDSLREGRKASGLEQKGLKMWIRAFMSTLN
jgi:hypothetical protein